MPRAHRYFLPGHVWHITHRCHKKEFLLKFAHDRRAWVRWLFEAKKRYGLCVLNYIVTSNHIHLLVKDTGREAIPKSMQLVAGRVAQEFNQRKARKGAFWEDRYHATAIATDHHFFRCLTYIDLNMVRAGAVENPADWSENGYAELLQGKQRYNILDYEMLGELVGTADRAAMQRERQKWIEDALALNLLERDACWSESLAVGDEEFVTGVKLELGRIGRRRTVINGSQGCVLREAFAEYSILPPKMPV